MEVKVHKGEGKLQQVLEIGAHQLLADAPKTYGGEDTGPEPHDILAAALGACVALTVTMYAGRKNIDLRDVKVRIEHCHREGTYSFTNHLEFVGNLSAEERARLADIAGRCPVHRTLTGQISIDTKVVD